MLPLPSYPSLFSGSIAVASSQLNVLLLLNLMIHALMAQNTTKSMAEAVKVT
jgi:hypothetical protein